MEAFPETVAVLRDAGLRTYFDRSFPIFMRRMRSFREAADLTPQEEREMRFMLEALLEAKRGLAERGKSRASRKI